MDDEYEFPYVQIAGMLHNSVTSRIGRKRQREEAGTPTATVNGAGVGIAHARSGNNTRVVIDSIEVDDGNEVQLMGSNGRGSKRPKEAPLPSASQVITVVDDDDDDVMLVWQPSSSSHGASSSSTASYAVESASTFRAGKGDCLICCDDTELFRVGLCEHALCPTCCLRTIRSQLSRSDAVSLPCPYCEEGNKDTAKAGAGAGDAGKAAAPAVENITGKGYFSELCVAAVFKWSNRLSKSAARITGSLSAGSLRAEALPENDLPDEERPLTEEEMRRVAEMVAAHALGVAGSKIITCPNLKCGERMASESTSASKQACPSCHSSLCACCGTDWNASEHDGRSCREVQFHQSTAQDMKELGSGDMAGTFKRCPVCGMGCEHRFGHGCHHITCMEKTCRANWCWVCCGPYPCKQECPLFCMDGLCDCIPCTDCKPQAKGVAKVTCSTCDGNSCPACSMKPAVKEVLSGRARKIVKKMTTGLWTGPRSTPRPGLTKDSYCSKRQNLAEGEVVSDSDENDEYDEGEDEEDEDEDEEDEDEDKDEDEDEDIDNPFRWLRSDIFGHGRGGSGALMTKRMRTVIMIMTRDILFGPPMANRWLYRPERPIPCLM